VAGAAVAGAAVAGAPVSREPAHSGSGQEPTADASYSGAPGTVPAAMLDGDQSTGWSNYYHKAQTANLLAVSVSNPSDWVALSWPQPQSFDSAVAYFTTGGPLALPAAIAVSYWDGREFAPVRNQVIDWATGSNQPTTLTFDPVRTSQIRLDMTSAAPGTGGGFLMIAELQARGNGVKIG
jgi:beta-galactosidase